MPDKSKDAKKAWETIRQEDLCRHMIVILKKTPNWAAESSFFGDDTEDATTFMWGRSESNYQLFIRGREYGWTPVSIGIHRLAKHLEYCIKFDQDFYKEPELVFPKGETFVTKKDLSSAEE